MAWRNYNRNKYHAKKTEFNGRVYDSKHEAERAAELQLLERAGEITNLRYQVPYVLIPAQREPDTIGSRGGVKRGKLIERECVYVADFAYIDANGEEVIEDAKGMKTPEYLLKRKLALYLLGKRIREV